VTSLDVNFVVSAKKQRDRIPIDGIPVGSSMHGGLENIVCMDPVNTSVCLTEDRGSNHLSNARTDHQD